MVASERPAHAFTVERHDVGAGEDEATLVSCDLVAEPIGSRERSDERIEPVGLDGLLVTGSAIDQGQPLEVVGATAANHLGLEPDVDVVASPAHVADQVARHRRVERLSRTSMTTRRAYCAMCSAA